MNAAAVAAANSRSSKIDRSSIGARLRCSISTKAGSRTIAAARPPITIGSFQPDSPYWQSGVLLLIVGVGSGLFNSPNTAAMMGAVQPERRGIAAGARTMLQNTGAVVSIAFVLAIVTAAVPQDVLFKIFSGLASGLTPAQLDPFIHNMHTALAVLALTSLVGAGVSLLRPRDTSVRAVYGEATT